MIKKMSCKIRRGRKYSLYPNGVVYEGSKYITTIADNRLLEQFQEEKMTKDKFDEIISGGEDAIKKFYVKKFYDKK